MTNIANAESYDTPPHGWTCFHCGENFPGNYGGQRAAQEHFGASIDAIPGCRLRMRAGEVSLLRRIRWLERLLVRYQDEDSDKDRELHAMRADHARALMREEENGYARGLRYAAEPPGGQQEQGHG